MVASKKHSPLGPSPIFSNENLFNPSTFSSVLTPPQSYLWPMKYFTPSENTHCQQKKLTWLLMPLDITHF